VLASDMNSGLWIFRVTLGRDQAPSGGSAASPPATAAPAPAPGPAGSAAARGPAGPDLLSRLATVGLVLGLLAAALVARNARRRRAG
jgi:hypothetical protein